MTALAALLAAVRAAPADDAPRLVLADYLLDRGDPRGELIHVQCTLARMSIEDPKRAELAAVEQALIARRPPPAGTHLAYTRGLASASVQAFRARDAIPFLADEPWIDRLQLEDCGGGGDERWAGIGALIEATMPRLTELELRGVVWWWYESDWDDTGRMEREEIDETAQCEAMFARLPPRPATLTRLSVPDAIVTLDRWWPRS